MPNKNCETCEECHKDTLLRLVERSEDRIDRTNEMISKCVSIIDKITAEYTHQLEEIQKSRDMVISDNKRLITLSESLRKDYEILNTKYDKLVDRMLAITSRGCENNINVK